MTNKLVKSDFYKDKCKFLDAFMTIYINAITGQFINFAICEFYNDDTFSQLSQHVMNTIVNIDFNQVKEYDKIHKKVFTLFEHFYRSHVEVLFAKFDFSLI